MKDCKIFDAHTDTLSELFDKKISFADENCMVSAQMIKNYTAYLQTFACFVTDEEQKPFQKAKQVAEFFYKEMGKNGLVAVRTKKDVEDIFRKNLHGGMLSIENGKAIENKLYNLDELYLLGYRMMTLTWNGDNAIARGAFGNGETLSAFGKKVLKKMNGLGMVIDLSHLSRQSFWEVAKCTDAPFIASHSNSFSMCENIRNLTDSQIKEIARRGGVVGINFYPPFLEKSGRADIFSVAKHIFHLLDLGVEDAVGIGSDYDGISCTALGLEKAEKMYHLFDIMAEKGVNKHVIEKITHQNFVRLFCQVLK